MDPQLARAITLLYEASVQMGQELEHLTRLYDDHHRLVSALHDLVPAEPVRLDSFRRSAS
jgi:hypothetical protein